MTTSEKLTATKTITGTADSPGDTTVVTHPRET